LVKHRARKESRFSGNRVDFAKSNLAFEQCQRKNLFRLLSENKKSVGKIDPTKGDLLGNILWVSER
jgi:hypothetical protein